MRIEFPKEVQEFIDIILREGHGLFAVGGVVRDHFIKKATTDFDLVTSSDIHELKELLPSQINVHEHYGILNFRISSYDIEIARMRSDCDYTGRHSDVNFICDIRDDLIRRDFTVNALAVELPNGEVIDLFDGLKDIQDRLIRTIGFADQRFKEDAFRMIRAISFALRLQFKLDDSALKSIQQNCYLVKSLAPGLVGKELYKLLRIVDIHAISEILIETRMYQFLFGFSERKKWFPFETADISSKISYLLFHDNLELENFSKVLLHFQFPRSLRKKSERLFQALKSISRMDSMSDWDIFSAVCDIDKSNLKALCIGLGLDFEKLKILFPGMLDSQIVNGKGILSWVGKENSREIGRLLALIKFHRYKLDIKDLQQARNWVLEELSNK